MMQRQLATAMICLLFVVAVFISPAGAAQERERPARIGGKPDLNGIWQAMNTAYWDLEGHSAKSLKDYPQLGAIFAIPAGQSVVVGGRIPYLPGAREKPGRLAGFRS